MPESEPPLLQQTSGTGCLLRLFWMIGGNVVVLACAVSIGQPRASFLSAADIIYWIAVAAVVAARYYDVSKLGGMTAQGRPASMRDWRRYALLLLAGALVVWAGVHAWSAFSR